MKKVIKNIIIALAALLVVAVAAVILYMWPMFSMAPSDTGMVLGTEILALQNGKNSLYFVTSADGYIAVDAGTNQQGIENGLLELGVHPLAVGAVLLTHTDSDHVAALSLFANAVIYMNVDEAQMIDGTTDRGLMQANALPDDVEGRVVWVMEGEQLELLGHTVGCISVPGHTPGSMAFLVDGEYLFTGDAMRVQAGKASVHPFTMDKLKAQSSIQRLLAENPDTLIFTAHYGVHDSKTLIVS